MRERGKSRVLSLVVGGGGVIRTLRLLPAFPIARANIPAAAPPVRQKDKTAHTAAKGKPAGPGGPRAPAQQLQVPEPLQVPLRPLSVHLTPDLALV